MNKFLLAGLLTMGVSLNLMSDNESDKPQKLKDDSSQSSSQFQSQSTQSFSDGTYDVTIVTKNGNKTVTVRKNGKLLAENLKWSERKQLPQDVQDKIKSLSENSKGFGSFELDLGNMKSGMKISGDIGLEIDKMLKNFRARSEKAEKEMSKMWKDLEKGEGRIQIFKGKDITELDRYFDDVLKSMRGQQGSLDNHLHAEAIADLQEKNYHVATKKFLKLANSTLYQSMKASAYYNAACGYALMNKEAEAMVCLKKAIKEGYRDFDHMMADQDLKILHKHDGFKNMLKPYHDYVKAKAAFEKSLSDMAQENVDDDLAEIFKAEFSEPNSEETQSTNERPQKLK